MEASLALSNGRTDFFSQKIFKYISYPKSIIFFAICGCILLPASFLDLFDESLLSLLIFTLIQLLYLLSLFLGILISMYNIAISMFAHTMDESTTYISDREYIYYRRKLKRAIIIALYWFIGIISLHIIFQADDILIISGICFLLTILFFFLEKDEFPFAHGF